MSDAATRYATVADGFQRRLESVPSDRWSSPSPCPDWSARDVATHVVDTTRGVLARLDGSEPATIGPDEDVVLAWKSTRAEVESALADQARAGTTISGGLGEQRWDELVATMLCADTLIHTWDLAVATGQDDRLDPEAVSAATAFLTPNDEMLRRPGGFGPKLEPPADADEQARLLAFVGRQVDRR